MAAVGEGVTTCRPGDRVVAQVEYGAYAEKCIVRALNCHVMPASMTYAEGAAMGLTYLTAHFALVERGTYGPAKSCSSTALRVASVSPRCNWPKRWAQRSSRA